MRGSPGGGCVAPRAPGARDLLVVQAVILRERARAARACAATCAAGSCRAARRSRARATRRRSCARSARRPGSRSRSCDGWATTSAAASGLTSRACSPAACCGGAERPSPETPRLALVRRRPPAGHAVPVVPRAARRRARGARRAGRALRASGRRAACSPASRSTCGCGSATTPRAEPRRTREAQRSVSTSCGESSGPASKTASHLPGAIAPWMLPSSRLNTQTAAFEHHLVGPHEEQAPALRVHVLARLERRAHAPPGPAFVFRPVLLHPAPSLSVDPASLTPRARSRRARTDLRGRTPRSRSCRGHR